MRKISLSLLTAALLGLGTWFALHKSRPADATAAPAPAISAPVVASATAEPTAPAAPEANGPVKSHVKGAKTEATPTDPSAEAPPLDLSVIPPNVQKELAKFSEALKSKDNADLLKEITASKDSLKGLDRGRFITEAANLLAADPARAAKLLKEMSDPRDQQLFGNMIASALVAKDPKSAAAWAKTLDSGLPARALYETIGREWAGSDRQAALDWVNGLNNETQTILQSAAAEGVAWDWAQKDIPELTKWAAGIKDEYIRNAVFVKAAKVLALSDAPAAAKWSLTFPPGLASRQATVYAVTQWANSNVNEAANFAQEIPNQEIKNEALIGVAKVYQQNDPAAAKGFISKLPADVQKHLAPTPDAPPELK